jgi:hypothetical protein
MNGDLPILPAGATEVEAPQEVNEDRGPISVLYPASLDGSDGFYPLPCEPSIGGTLPPDEAPTKEELDSEKELAEFEDGQGETIAAERSRDIEGRLPVVDAFALGKCYVLDTSAGTGKPGARQEHPCDSTMFLLSGQPFEGRDIIFVHGLATEHLAKRLGNFAPALKLWPEDAAEFLDPAGYFREYAEEYWRGHIKENLFDPQSPSNPQAGWQWTATDAAPLYNPKSNRYLAVAWSSNQTLEYAQHALITQVALAMSSNKNVVTPPTYPSTHVRPFCSNSCIIVSHSTGPLVTGTAMSLASAGSLGPGGVIVADHIRAQVAFEGATSGSRLATVGMAIGLAANPSQLTLCRVLESFLDLATACQGDTSFLANSILLDLMPVVAQGIWGPILNESPMPTVTVAGGHPPATSRQ